MMILYATTMWSDKQKDDRNRQVSAYDNDPGPAGDDMVTPGKQQLREQLDAARGIRMVKSQERTLVYLVLILASC